MELIVTTETYPTVTFTHYKIPASYGSGRGVATVGRWAADPSRTVISFMLSDFLPTLTLLHVTVEDLEALLQRAAEFALNKYMAEMEAEEEDA